MGHVDLVPCFVSLRRRVSEEDPGGHLQVQAVRGAAHCHRGLVEPHIDPSAMAGEAKGTGSAVAGGRRQPSGFASLPDPLGGTGPPSFILPGNSRGSRVRLLSVAGANETPTAWASTPKMPAQNPSSDSPQGLHGAPLCMPYRNLVHSSTENPEADTEDGKGGAPGECGQPPAVRLAVVPSSPRSRTGRAAPTDSPSQVEQQGSACPKPWFGEAILPSLKGTASSGCKTPLLAAPVLQSVTYYRPETKVVATQPQAARRSCPKGRLSYLITTYFRASGS